MFTAPSNNKGPYQVLNKQKTVFSYYWNLLLLVSVTVQHKVSTATNGSLQRFSPLRPFQSWYKIHSLYIHFMYASLSQLNQQCGPQTICESTGAGTKKKRRKIELPNHHKAIERWPSRDSNPCSETTTPVISLIPYAASDKSKLAQEHTAIQWKGLAWYPRTEPMQSPQCSP